MPDLYNNQQIVDYNENPPPDDASKVTANLASWAGILGKLTDPLKSFTTAVDTAVGNSFKKTISGGSVRYLASPTETLAVTDQGKLVIANDTGANKTFTLLDPLNIGAPFAITICNVSNYGLFINSLGPKLINGVSLILVAHGQSIGLQTDGQNWYTFGGYPIGATGDISWSFATTAPAGFIALETKTIGSGSSGSVYAGTLYQPLYEFLWTNVSDAFAPVTGGRGSTAANDFTANKPLTMPGMEGRSMVGLDPTNSVITTASLNGANAAQMGGTGGADMHTLVIAEAPSDSLGFGTGGFGTGGTTALVQAGGERFVPTNGQNQPHNNMGPWRTANCWIRL